MHHSKLAPIIKQLLEIQATGKAHVHIHFGGHVDEIDVSVHIPKWERGKEPDVSFKAYVDQDRSWEQFEKQVNIFIKLFNILNQ